MFDVHPWWSTLHPYLKNGPFHFFGVHEFHDFIDFYKETHTSQAIFKWIKLKDKNTKKKWNTHLKMIKYECQEAARNASRNVSMENKIKNKC